MSKSTARSVALALLQAVEFDDAYANLLLPKLVSKAALSSRDAALAQELAYGTLRWQLFYDRVIEECAQRYSDEIDLDALIILRLGAHQLLATRIPPHAALSETVELAKKNLKPSAIGFINGVLRRVSERDRDTWEEIILEHTEGKYEYLAVKYSHPIWVVKALEQSLKLDKQESRIESLLAADNIPAKIALVALPGLDASTQGLQVGSASPIGFILNSGDPSELESVADSSLRVQDEGSQLAALALSRLDKISDNERWLDMCAGPGGKAALLAAEAVQSGATLVCNEVSQHRTELVRKALRAIRGNVSIRTGDGRQIGQLEPASYDRILLDAPCTGLGALRRRPEARWRKSPDDVSELAQLQWELIDSAIQALKPGGYLAYVTCSPHPGETAAIVDKALKNFPHDLAIIDATDVVSKLSPALDLPRNRKTVQLWPDRDGTDAMFISLFRKSNA
ncbi:RsmB/NOP family class I SAM-dependent RNA methyltransferase [Candidatus Rhodoluna planktonica]|uniref:SAM-dependent MTase RsmB/NOP-type domain-containing protein n=1 Tax=Candidatus Rhodoluna planktonica TaxID=535712 RepID=A0A1D9DZ28_9MICO|nr:transcription antitermination factor NusB [Candidatus Rhodoluna planktonica]AOY56067.1 hypothetical protein A4Z71_03600 [Candidatus Rhodoluna planktonica]